MPRRWLLISRRWLLISSGRRLLISRGRLLPRRRWRLPTFRGRWTPRISNPRRLLWRRLIGRSRSYRRELRRSRKYCIRKLMSGLSF